MNKIESLKDFYQRKFNWMPGNLGNEIGHFNVFQLDPYVGQGAQPVPYKRRDFYKIMLVLGQGRVHYADRVFEVKKQALTFSNPWIPYKWENTDQIDSGVFCIFNAYFFNRSSSNFPWRISIVFPETLNKIRAISEANIIRNLRNRKFGLL